MSTLYYAVVAATPQINVPVVDNGVAAGVDDPMHPASPGPGGPGMICG
ncbi:hypothetical protein [Mangrovihabitans endophyticus]|nr:hypothetical protein [Mangrovihabitans endophyticus]